jgi:hypothetical protein
MHGMGGIGKSVLAATLARDRKIREAFPDGIVWVGLGPLPNVADLQRRVHRDLGGDGAFQTEHEGRVKLRDLLKDKGVLLILDDVWRREDVDWFNVLGPRCRAMITTRDAGLLTSLGGTHHQVELLTDAEALNLLAQAAGVERDKLPSEAADLIAECGRLPLAVGLCGGLIRHGFAWAKVLDQLRNSRRPSRPLFRTGTACPGFGHRYRIKRLRRCKLKSGDERLADPGNVERVQCRGGIKAQFTSLRLLKSGNERLDGPRIPQVAQRLGRPGTRVASFGVFKSGDERHDGPAIVQLAQPRGGERTRKFTRFTSSVGVFKNGNERHDGPAIVQLSQRFNHGIMHRHERVMTRRPHLKKGNERLDGPAILQLPQCPSRGPNQMVVVRIPKSSDERLDGSGSLQLGQRVGRR